MVPSDRGFSHIFLTTAVKRQKIFPYKTHALISAYRRQRQADLCEFKATLVYIRRFRPVLAEWNPVLNKNLLLCSCPCCGCY